MTIAKHRGEPIHTRRIAVETYEYDQSAVLVEGRLTDNRFVNTYYFTGGTRPPGIVHDMIIRLVVRGPDPTIESIEVEMPGIPREECIETQQSLAPIAGMKISPGFTDRVKAEVGGAKGCTHLVALLLAMAPAALQGAWVAMARQPVDMKVFGGAALQILENTCRVWRSDGPLMEALKERIEKGK
ncbi:MAG: DUF2889 domain-containing protein [Desulfobacteraceae bacterium]|jgi:hypothetical protein|nr:MAG: DUF2889 domain-containing protein [Desulfobacteraceae bacterium]